MSPEEVLQLAAMAWALLFAYLPPAKAWFDELSVAMKLALQLGVFAVIVFGAVAGACLGLLSVFPCADWASALLAGLVLFIKVVLANQGMYQATRLIAKARGAE